MKIKPWVWWVLAGAAVAYFLWKKTTATAAPVEFTPVAPPAGALPAKKGRRNRYSAQENGGSVTVPEDESNLIYSAPAYQMVEDEAEGLPEKAMKDDEGSSDMNDLF